MSSDGAELTQFTHREQVTPAIRAELIECWVDVTNSGGAAGFPFPPVDARTVAPVAEALVDGLDPRRRRLLVATRGDVLAGWVTLERGDSPLIAHWGTVRHLQTRPAQRDNGIGSALMREVRHVARTEMGLEQLHLAVRGGAGLEGFYARLGWREIGRWPAALRLAAGDTRDEVLMLLAPL